MKKYLKFFLSILLFAVFFTGCSQNTATEEKTETAQETESGNESAETIEFTDSAGRKVTIPKNVERIAPVGPPAQQMLLTFAPEKMVGITGELKPNVTKYIGEEYAKLPAFGAFYGAGDINMEAIAAADPQLIIDIGERKESVIQDMDGIQEQLNIPTIFIEATMETMPEAYEQLGKVLGKEAEGKEFSEYCAKTYKEVTDKLAEIPEDQRKSFLYTGGENGLNVISKDSFHAEITDMMGNNVAVLETETSRGSGDPVSEEVILSWDPDFILFQPKSIYDDAKTNPVFSTMGAVTDGNVYETPSSPYSWLGSPPSINRYMGMLWLGKLFYPETFDYDLKDKTKEYYNLFYNYDLTDDEYNELTAKSMP